MRLLTSEQVENIKKYGQKCSFSWARGKSKYRIRRLWHTNKGIDPNSIKQIKPEGIYFKNNNWVKMAICSHRSFNKKEGTILHHCDWRPLLQYAEIWVKEEDLNIIKRLREVGYWFRNIPNEKKIGGCTGLTCRDKYNPSLVGNDRLVTFKFLQW